MTLLSSKRNVKNARRQQIIKQQQKSELVKYCYPVHFPFQMPTQKRGQVLDGAKITLTLFHTSPGFYLSAVEVF